MRSSRRPTLGSSRRSVAARTRWRRRRSGVRSRRRPRRPTRRLRARPSSGLTAEVDVLRLDRSGRPPRRGLVLPVEVCVRDHLLRRRRSPRGLVLRRVGIADESRVIPAGEGAVERRADARIGLRSDDDEPPDTEAGEDCLEVRVLEGVAVALLDERLGLLWLELRDDPPLVAPSLEPLVVVLDPDDGHIVLPRFLDEAADVRDDRVALGGALDDAVLHVDDEECRVRTVLECGHAPPSYKLSASSSV